MRELWIFGGGGVLGVPSGTSYVTRPGAERTLCTKLSRLERSSHIQELQIDTCEEVGWEG